MTRLHAINVAPRGSVSLLEQYKLNVADCRSIEQLMDTFFFETQTWLELSGLSYNHSSRRHNLEIGVADRHRYTYKLYKQRNYLGEVVLTNNHRLEDDELHLTETLLGILIFPLARIMGIPRHHLRLVHP
ncbi:MAG: hypothetical protein CMP98_07260 [Gammaproteobacteria bacterium]|nr:hypothetical protein [Gammaproteobacteria bacterium]OUU09574.1 MAG: hypothetical protein CBB94_07420 [Gammaproteobacteria bacterium TMED34]|tara:strand:- start:12 stop:401 length:390 start_codon:yes stop_codon:yes gene_type:complete